MLKPVGEKVKKSTTLRYFLRQMLSRKQEKERKDTKMTWQN